MRPRLSLDLKTAIAQNRDVIRGLFTYAWILVATVLSLFCSQHELAIVELAVRQQPTVYTHKYAASGVTLRRQPC